MRKILSALLLVTLVLSVVPGVFAVSAGDGIGVEITTEDFVPQVFQCPTRVVLDDGTEPGRISEDGQFLVERMNNYAFEGEQIQWQVIVWDKNGLEKISDVYATIGSSQGEGNDIEANCVFNQEVRVVPDSCNARILEEELGTEQNPFADNTAGWYTCTLTVETADSMYGEYWVTVEAEDLDGLLGTMDENEYWFFNPMIALTIDGSLEFDNVRPGTSSYSETIAVGNDADEGSGVRMDMFISGTDFYDSSSSGAKCPVTNQLSLDSFRYFATHGAYSTQADARSDAEGYVGIGYGVGFNDPNPFYDAYEIMQSGPKNGPYYQSNIVSPGAEMSVTFRLDLPEPCNGDFDTGSIYFWGEAI
jgi:hypothetical protein